jgi:hypothetical protein
MGCDIHVVLEKKIKVTDMPEEWATVNVFNAVRTKGLSGFVGTRPTGLYWYTVESRDYAYFGDLTDGAVRGGSSDEFIYPLRGLPDDLAPLTKATLEYWHLDGHSHSWLYADEFLPVFAKHFISNAEIAQHTADRLEGYEPWRVILPEYFNVAVESDDESPSNFRFVFWFDS